MKSHTKPKAIDLGSLQESFDVARKQLVADARALVRAQEAFDHSKQVFEKAQEALKSAARVVLT